VTTVSIEQVNSKVVKAVLPPGGSVLARRGAMLCYTGDVQFQPHSTGGGHRARGWAALVGWWGWPGARWPARAWR